MVTLLLMKEDVRRFHVSVEDPQLVQGFQTTGHLNEDPPHVVLLEGAVLFLVVQDLLVHVAVTRVLHHYTQTLLVVLNEGFLVTYHVRVSD